MAQTHNIKDKSFEKMRFVLENLLPGAVLEEPRRRDVFYFMLFLSSWCKLVVVLVKYDFLFNFFSRVCVWLWGADACGSGTKAFPRYKQQLLRIKAVAEKPLFPRSLFKRCVSIIWTQLMEALTSNCAQVERLIRHWCQPFKTSST